MAGYAKDHLLETFKVPSASMLPTIVPGDRFFADKRVGHPDGVKISAWGHRRIRVPNDRTTCTYKADYRSAWYRNRKSPQY